MKTKSVLMAVIVAAMLIPQSLAFGQRRGFGGWGGMFGGPMQAAYLGLTQDQMSQIKTMRQTQWSTLKPLMQQLRT
ncbi:MAG: periplasmic heavy metal sensor, partial [Terriglobia bacterium]